MLIFWTTPIYVFMIGLEIILSNYHHRTTYTLRDTLNNFLLMLLNGGLDLLFRAFYVVILVFFWQHRFTQIETPWLYWLMPADPGRFCLLLAAPVRPSCPAILGGACNPPFFRKIEFLRWFQVIRFSAAVQVCLLYPACTGWISADGYRIYVLCHTDMGNHYSY